MFARSCACVYVCEGGGGYFPVVQGLEQGSKNPIHAESTTDGHSPIASASQGCIGLAADPVFSQH